MTYKETVQYLYDCVPMFQKIGAGGYKEGLENTLAFDEHLNHPHRNYKTIHVAGTNGKGSCSHTIASILQHAGYKVGLYTSPHLVDFRERIRVNGKPISEEYVVKFVESERDFFEPLHPSFFEVTTALAFQYFKDMNVDVAVIEVGLGGRLDCTNIISPIVSLITNISFDHVQFLGHTLAEIAGEKAGIIKSDVPVVIGEYNAQTKSIFEGKALEVNAPIVFAEDVHEVLSCNSDYVQNGIRYETKSYGEFNGELSGICQEKNTNTILCALPFIKKAGFNISNNDVTGGFAKVCETTGLMGRWQKIYESPLAICDTGHNEGGFQYISKQLNAYSLKHTRLRIVFGMVNDKDISKVLSMLPTNACYYFTKASIVRALNELDLQQLALKYNLSGKTYPTVWEAYEAALADAATTDFIYVGGSSYIVADLLSALQSKTT